MSSEPAAQVAEFSVDLRGVSVSTATRGASDSTQQGSVYDLSSLAAAVPVWFHPLDDGSYQAVLRTRWVAATPAGGPQKYSARTDTEESAWFRFNPETGFKGAVSPIPSSSSGGVVAGASKSAYLWLLRSGGVVQLFRSGESRLLLQGEEECPVAAAEWLGLHVAGANLRVFYSLSGEVHYAERPASTVGLVAGPWSYWAGQGMSSVPGDAVPLATRAGPLTSAGPVSAAAARGRMWITTVELDSGTYTGRSWSSRGAHDPWSRGGLEEPLGTSSTWCGQGVQLQPQLPARPAAVAAAGVPVAVPWVKSVKGSAGGAYWIDTTWGLLPVDQA